MNNVIVSKTDSIRRCVQRIRTAYGRSTNLPFSEDYDKQEKVISSKLAENLGNMTSFRNIAVHRYQQLSLNIVENIIAEHLDDFEALIQAVLKQSGLFEDAL